MIKTMKMIDKSILVIVLVFVLSSGGEVSLICSDSPITNSQCCTCEEADQPQSPKCVGQCPQYYFVSNDDDTAVCVQPTTPVPTDTTRTTTGDKGNSTTGNSTADVTAQGSATGLTTNRTDSPESTAPPRQRVVLCRRCHETCKSCNGSAAEDCLTCKSDFELSIKNGTTICVKKKTGEGGGVSTVIIAGAAAAGGAIVLILVVVLVVCLCRRRRRRKRDQEQGPGMIVMDDIGSSQEEERGEKEKVETLPSRSKHLEEPTYINVQATSLRPLSIERGHDKVTRYVRDPTVKQKVPEPALTEAEQQEVESLPLAPRPPRANTKPKTAPRQEAREVMETAAPEESYEDVDLPPTHSSTPRATKRKGPARGKTTVVKTGGANGAGPRRRTESSLAPLPYPASPVSCPEMARFPIEVEESAKQGSRGRRRPAFTVQEEMSVSDPEEDYVNVGSKENLVAAATERGGARAQPVGLGNPAAEEDDSQEDYCNQGVIEEVKGRALENSAAQMYMDMGGGGGHKGHDDFDHDDDEHVYGNEITDELDDHPYQNVRYPPSKS